MNGRNIMHDNPANNGKQARKIRHLYNLLRAHQMITIGYRWRYRFSKNLRAGYTIAVNAAAHSNPISPPYTSAPPTNAPTIDILINQTPARTPGITHADQSTRAEPFQVLHPLLHKVRLQSLLSPKEAGPTCSKFLKHCNRRNWPCGI